MAPEILDSAFEVEVSTPEPAAPTSAPSVDAPATEPPTEPTDPPDGESDRTDPDAGAVDGSGGAGEEDKTAAEASEAGRKLNGKKKSLQERLDQTTWEKHEAIRKAADLEARLKALEEGKAPAKPQAPQADPDDPAPTVEQFETYEEFVDARSAWRARQEYRALRERDERAQADRAMQGRLSDLETKALEKHADFVPVMTEFAESGRSFAANPFIHRVILEHPDGHSIAYALAKDPATFDRIHHAPNFAVASVELGKLVARLDAAPTGSAPRAVPPVTRAKAPVSPVGSSPVVSDRDPNAIEDFEEYLRVNNTREKIPMPSRR